MSKVKCIDCKHWQDSGRKRKHPKAMFSLSYTYRSVGYCMNDDCGRATSGYTGNPSGRKMERIGQVERYCPFFEETDELKKKLDNLLLSMKEASR